MITALALALLGQTHTFTHMSDAQFLRKYAGANMAEVTLSQYVQDHSRSRKIRDACEMMINDHNNALDKIQEMARRMGVDLPTEMPDYEANYLKDLRKMTGRELDQRFALHMAHDHASAVNDFQIEARYGRNQWVKNYATDTLPALREHLQLWKDLSAGVLRRGSGGDDTRRRGDGGR